jgi:hypothetical protein
MPRRKIKPDAGHAALTRVIDGEAQDADLATACRYLLEELAERAPGNSVEVRVPPFGATQCIEGPRHTRGTPPNTIELDPETWVALATGKISWSTALADSLIAASGTRADISEHLPLI